MTANKYLGYKTVSPAGRALRSGRLLIAHDAVSIFHLQWELQCCRLRIFIDILSEQHVSNHFRLAS